MLLQIMYSSQAAEAMSVGDLEKILDDARAGNTRRGVTGALVYVEGVFFQILEGDAPVVRQLLANIARDGRHQAVKVFYEAEVAERAFGSWGMAYLSASAEQAATWAGLPGTVTFDALLAEVEREPQRAPRLLVSVLKALST